MGVLRILLAISVIIAHSDSFFGVVLIGGEHAVQIFFMISGFYMALILNEKYVGDGSYKLFIINRALKIYPAYFISIILVIFTSIASFLVLNSYGKITPYVEYFDSMNLVSIIFLIASNLFVLGQDVVMFLGLNVDNGELYFTPDFKQTSPMLFNFLLNPPAWSISVELMFYIVAPFLVIRKTYILLLLVILSLTIKFGLSYYSNLSGDPWSYRFFPSALSFFLVGSIGYKLYKYCFLYLRESTINKVSCFLFTLSIVSLFTFTYFDENFYILYFIFYIFCFYTICVRLNKILEIRPKYWRFVISYLYISLSDIVNFSKSTLNNES